MIIKTNIILTDTNDNSIHVSIVGVYDAGHSHLYCRMQQIESEDEASVTCTSIKKDGVPVSVKELADLCGCAPYQVAIKITAALWEAVNH